jgi:hypothetical protein
MQVVDDSCGNGYEPEGREFESLRARHSNQALAEKFPELLVAWGVGMATLPYSTVSISTYLAL